MVQNSQKSWNVFPVLLVAFLCAFSASPVKAEVYKCESTKGKIVYSDTPCHSSSTQTITDIQANLDIDKIDHQSAEKMQSPVMRQLDEAVMSAIANEDFIRADALAVTREHHEWITTAKKDAARNMTAGRTEADLLAEKSNSDECAQAKLSLEKEAGSTFRKPDVLAAKTSLMHVSCGIDDDPGPTYVQANGYGRLFNPYHYYPYKKPGYSPHRPRPLQPVSYRPRQNYNDGLSIRIR